MAVLLIVANIAAWSMPVVVMAGQGAQGAAHAMASASAHHHCGAAMAAKGGMHMRHDGHCACCAGGACACLHGGAVLPGGNIAKVSVLPMKHELPAPAAVLADAAGKRRLRPPIA